MTALSDAGYYGSQRSGAAVRAACRLQFPALTNLFGTPSRVARGHGRAGRERAARHRPRARQLKNTMRPKGLKDAAKLLQMVKALWDMKPATVRRPVCQEEVLVGNEVDLAQLPVQTCWPGDADAAHHLGASS